MSPEAQRIAIAEACGWQGPQHPDNVAGMAGWWSQSRGVWWKRPDCVRVMASAVPDYLTDLNAMHEAEKVLTEHQRIVYKETLADITPHDPSVSLWGLCHATAAQRAEAFLRTIGKWESSP